MSATPNPTPTTSQTLVNKAAYEAGKAAKYASRKRVNQIALFLFRLLSLLPESAWVSVAWRWPRSPR